MAEQVVELTCWVCGRSFMGTGKRANRIGPRPDHDDCWKARDKIDWICRSVRAKRAQAHCRYCAEPRVVGSHFCPRHQFRKDPCEEPGCINRVRRNEGQGGQPRHCEEHRRSSKAMRVDGGQTEGIASDGR